MSSDQAMNLNKASQIRYVLRHLRMLPPPYQTDDSNRITFGFFALCSLAILGGLDRLDQSERDDYIDWIYCTWDDTTGGFCGAPKQELRSPGTDIPNYDQPHLTHTYTALLILALLTLPSTSSERPQLNNSPYVKLNLRKLLLFVSNCQCPNGSFSSFPNSPDEDVRFVYCAITILTMVKVDPSTVINVKSTLSFLKSCRRYEGGYGQSPYAEAQGGTTYCVIASLAMLNELENSLTEVEYMKTLRWLVDRQGELSNSLSIQRESDDLRQDDVSSKSPATLEAPNPPATCKITHFLPSDFGYSDQMVKPVAGFQGRIGKPLDACYSFWCTGALTIMTKRPTTKHSKVSFEHNLTSSTTRKTSKILYDPESNIQFLLLCQSKQWGGIARSPGDHPDVYHTYLALASLSLSHFASTQQNGSKGYEGGEIHDSLDGFLEHDPLLNVPMKVSNWIYQCFAP